MAQWHSGTVGRTAIGSRPSSLTAPPRTAHQQTDYISHMKRTKKTKKVRKSKKVTKPAKRTAMVSELKASLSQYLARVKAGDEVVVTERGTPIAKLVPIPPGGGEGDEDDPQWARLRQMAAQGLVTLGTGKIPDEFWELPRPDDPEGLVLKGLLEDRETSR